MSSPPKGTDLEKEKKEETDLPETKATKILTNKLISGDPYDPMIQNCLTQPSTKDEKWLDDMAWGFYEEEPKKASLKGKECDSSDSEEDGEAKEDTGSEVGGEPRAKKKRRVMTKEEVMKKKVLSPKRKTYAKAIEMRPNSPFEFIWECLESKCKEIEEGVKDGNKN